MWEWIKTQLSTQFMLFNRNQVVIVSRGDRIRVYVDSDGAFSTAAMLTLAMHMRVTTDPEWRDDLLAWQEKELAC